MISSLLAIVTVRIALVWCAILSVVAGHAVLVLLNHRLRSRESTAFALATIGSAIVAVACAANIDD